MGGVPQAFICKGRISNSYLTGFEDQIHVLTQAFKKLLLFESE